MVPKFSAGRFLVFLLNNRENPGSIIVIWAKALWITVGGKNFPSFFERNMRELSIFIDESGDFGKTKDITINVAGMVFAKIQKWLFVVLCR